MVIQNLVVIKIQGGRFRIIVRRPLKLIIVSINMKNYCNFICILNLGVLLIYM